MMMDPMTGSSNSYRHQPQQEGLRVCTTDTNWFPNPLFVPPLPPVLQPNDMLIVPQNTRSMVAPMIQPYLMQLQIATSSSSTTYKSSLVSFHPPLLQQEQQQYHGNSNLVPLIMPSYYILTSSLLFYYQIIIIVLHCQ
jgi:hypothetical protein